MQTEKTFTDSRIVSGIRYNQDTKHMYITFVTNKTYEYRNVPVSVWEQALKAESIGSFVNNEIKGKYAYRPIN